MLLSNGLFERCNSKRQEVNDLIQVLRNNDWEGSRNYRYIQRNNNTYSVEMCTLVIINHSRTVATGVSGVRHIFYRKIKTR